MTLLYPAIFIGSYLLGSLSLSIIVSSKLFGGDIRGMGSGNAGATNMARVFGWTAGLLTLAGDAAKAIIPMLIANKLAGDVGLAVAGIGCIMGHCFPVLHYETLWRYSGLSCVRIALETGRTHQIRVQFVSRGWPLAGERKYCENPDSCPLALFSCALAFDHPVTGKRMRFAHEPPAVWPWTLCEELNSELK